MDNILELTNVTKIYGRDGGVTRASNGISFKVAKSEFVTIMGASGSGKTTLLNLIATIDGVSSGSIVVDGQDVTALGERALAAYRGTKLGFVFQEYNLLDTLTVYENIVLPLALRNTTPDLIAHKAESILEAFGIKALENKFPKQISGGERQRTACARALIGNPSLIIADEPTGALDSKNSKNLMRLLRQINADFGATILTVTHDPVVAAYASRVLFLKDGRLHNEIIKGEKSDESFFREILDVNAAAGGEDYVM